MRPERQRLKKPYPMLRIMERELDPRYEGPVFVWDIDKTYLETRFSQLKHIVKIPFEFGVDKQAVPGTIALLHGLREGKTGREHRPLFFVSASPPVLELPIGKKMLLDGVEYDGVSYKDWPRLILRREFTQVKEQIGYKLAALLMLYRDLPAGCRFHLFGDDAEKDALAFALFADVAAGRVRGRALHDTLVVGGTEHHYAEEIASLAEPLPERECVERIYVHLIRQPGGESIAEFGAGVLGCPTFFAAAKVLHTEGLLSDQSLESVRQAAPDGEGIFGKAPADDTGYWCPHRYLVL